MVVKADWKTRTGGITGPYHLSKGEESQDRVACSALGDFAICVAADGAGSLPLSGEGAQLAVSSVIDFLVESLSEGEFLSSALVGAAIEVARERLLAQENYAQMGCTLAVAVVSDESWAAGVVGDSFVVVKDTDGELHFVQEERKSEYANITALLTSKSFEPALVDGVGAVALAAGTDGMLHGTVEHGVPTAGFWNTVFTRVQDESLDLLDVLRHMESKDLIDDDTSVAMIVRA